MRAAKKGSLSKTQGWTGTSVCKWVQGVIEASGRERMITNQNGGQRLDSA